MSHRSLHGTACKGCRRRGRKCDRTLPTCLSCEHRGVACEGYITRWPGVAARGKLAGKSIPISDSLVVISKASPTRARQRHAHSTLAGSSDSKHNTSSNLSRQPSGSRLVSHDPLYHSSSLVNILSSAGNDDMDKLIKHCMLTPAHLSLGFGIFTTDFEIYVDIEDLSTIFYLGNGPSDNPMFRYILPLIDSVPPIRYAIAASASCHLAARTSDKVLEQKSLHLRVRATHSLRQILQDPGVATEQTILASILMLAQLDVKCTRLNVLLTGICLTGYRCVPETVSSLRRTLKPQSLLSAVRTMTTQRIDTTSSSGLRGESANFQQHIFLSK